VIFENLKLFRDIAQTKSISRGATLNEISQSAASQYMQEMERRLGVSLLDRTTRPLALTPAGKLFFDLCRDVLRREEQFQLQLDNLKGSVEGTVRVASIYSIGLSEMSRLQDEFAARFPHTELHVDYLRPDKVYEAVMGDQADLGLVSYPVGTKDLAVIPWREEEMAVAAPPSHPLAKKTVLLPADLNGQEFVGFDGELMIRRELAKSSNRFYYSAFSLPAFSPEFDARIARYRQDKAALQKELLARVQSLSPKNQNEPRNEEKIRQAIALFTQENAAHYAAIEKEREYLRNEIAKASSTGGVVVKGPFADALSQQFSEAQQQIEVWRNYREYQTAVFEPGLAPEQRRLLFDSAIEKLALPLPAGELSR